MLSCERKTTLTTIGESWLYCVLQMFYTYKSAEMICLPEVFFCQHQTCHYSPEWILRLTTHLLPITDKCDLDLQTKIFFLNVRERFHEIIQRKWKAEKKTQL